MLCCNIMFFFQVGIKARPGFVLSIWYHDNLRGHSDRGTDNDTSVTFLLSQIKINECCILHRHDKKKIAQDKTLDTHAFLFGYVRFLIWERNTEVAAKGILPRLFCRVFPLNIWWINFVLNWTYSSIQKHFRSAVNSPWRQHRRTVIWGHAHGKRTENRQR